MLIETIYPSCLQDFMVGGEQVGNKRQVASAGVRITGFISLAKEGKHQ